MLKYLNICCLTLGSISAVQVCAEPIPMTADYWEVLTPNYEFVRYLDRDALRVMPDSSTGDGVAVLKGKTSQEGTLEFDVALNREPAFVGALWRLQDTFMDGEMFYLRTQQSGFPDASQYMPIYNGVPSWQLYSKEGLYTQGMTLDFDQWMHVKIQIAGARGEIYVKDMSKPLLNLPLHRIPQPGMWALIVSSGVNPNATAYFSNVEFSSATPTLQAPAPQRPVAAPGTVLQWQVSDAFPKTELSGTLGLPDAVSNARTWKTFATDPDGLLNLAQNQGVGAIFSGNDTMLVKANLHTSQAQTKALNIGFSDSVRVYLNGQLVFLGNDTYASRDYRFLGIIGYYDTVPLQLRAGDNSLWLAITETGFDGWGVKAQLEEASDVQISLAPSTTSSDGTKEIERLIAWAEATYPDLFDAAHQKSFNLGTLHVRHYPNSNVFLGIMEGLVYLQAPNNNLLEATLVGTVADFLPRVSQAGF